MITPFNLHGVLLLFLLVSISLLIGYTFGRRLGVQKGIVKGRALDRIDMRTEAYKLGYCPICHQSPPVSKLESRAQNMVK